MVNKERERATTRAYNQLPKNREARRRLDRSPEGKANRRARHLKGRYGITADQYQNLLAVQGGGCAICGWSPGPEHHQLGVDHNHATGAIRGLLCIRCNSALEWAWLNKEKISQYIRRKVK